MAHAMLTNPGVDPVTIRFRCSALLIAGLLLGPVRAGTAQATLPPVYNPVNGHWYQAVSLDGDSIDWPTARAEAEALSSATWRAHLLTITSPEEHLFVSFNLPIKLQPHWW